jgi:hypothetical protein
MTEDSRLAVQISIFDSGRNRIKIIFINKCKINLNSPYSCLRLETSVFLSAT